MARFKVGDRVILGDHVINGVQVDWNPNMLQYVGKVATLVKRYKYPVPIGRVAWNVDLDNTYHYWYEDNMKPAIEYPDQKCIECNISAPHVEPEDGKYVCDFCKVLVELKEPTSQDRYEKNWHAIFGKK